MFFPFLKFLIAHSATLDLRERNFVENCLAAARISSRYFGSTTLSYSRKVSSIGSKFPASAIIDRSTPPGPEDAYRKAIKHGSLNEENVRINGKEGYCRFNGLRDLVLIYDDLEDGSELEWHDLRLSPSELRRLVKRKKQMQAFNIGPKPK